MKITAPVSSAREASSLITSGAEELYCGIHPKAGRRDEVWVNRRGPGQANISSFEELKEITRIAHSRDVPVFLTLNLPFYPPDQYPEILSLVDEVTGDCGIDALIIGDPGLMVALREEKPGAVIHVNSLAAVLNSEAASFFIKLGVSRIIFPRYVNLKDIRKIIAKTGSAVEYEVFILNDGCVFEEGYCHASHAFGGAFCHRPWSYSPVETGSQAVIPGRETFSKHLKDYREWLWYIRNCNGRPGPGGSPLGMCGLCAIPELRSLGISSLKIVGREAHPAKKTASVRLVRQMLDLSGTCPDIETSILMAKRIRNTPGLCASGFMCYFR